MKSSLRDIFSVLLLMAVCTYSMIQQMQILAIVSMVAILCVLYRWRAVQIVNIGFDLIRNTKQFKLSEFELQVDNKYVDLSGLTEQQAKWAQIVLSRLNSEHIGLLLHTHKVGIYKPTGVEKPHLRDLRARGLIQHDASSLGESTQVWLTELGKDLADALLQSSAIKQTLEESRASKQEVSVQ